MTVPQAGAALILRRSDGTVLTGIRTALARSWQGTIAFPGGAVDDTDHELPLMSGLRGPEGVRRAAALRESLEEAGVVRLCSTSGGPVDVAAVIAAVRSGCSLQAGLQAACAVLDDRNLVSLGSWLTAEGTFEVTRFLLAADDVVQVTPLVTELCDLAFRSPRALVEGWSRGTFFLLPPIRAVLHRLAEHEDVNVVNDDGALVSSLALPPSEAQRRRRDLIDGVVVIDTRTPTLAPATHTNCVVLGTTDVLLVDPATPYDDEQERFDDVLATILEGRAVRGVFLTHHHQDHMGDATRLARLHRCPVYAHAETIARVDLGADIDMVRVSDGDDFALGTRCFRAVFTPGHAPGHLCLFDAAARMLIAGDMIAGIGSILIDPPEGHMSTYLASLDRLIALQPRALVPAHGPLLVDATSRLSEQKQHRLRRQASVVAAIAAGAEDVHAVVLAVYGQDTPEAMFAFAARSVVAIVQKLQEDAVVVEVDGRWRSAA